MPSFSLTMLETVSSSYPSFLLKPSVKSDIHHDFSKVPKEYSNDTSLCLGAIQTVISTDSPHSLIKDSGEGHKKTGVYTDDTTKETRREPMRWNHEQIHSFKITIRTHMC